MRHYVALDIGNVLCTIDFKAFTSAISKITNLSIWEVGHRVNISQKLWDAGLITMTGVLESEFDIKSPVIIDELMDIWNKKVLIFDNRMFDYLNQISDSVDMNIALLSNVGFEHSKIIDKFLSHYNGLHWRKSIRYYSCDVGAIKPQSLYYQSFLQRYPDFTGCVYLDDLKENLEASIKFGFKAVEFNLEKISSLDEKEAMLKQIGSMIMSTTEEKNSRRH